MVILHSRSISIDYEQEVKSLLFEVCDQDINEANYSSVLKNNIGYLATGFAKNLISEYYNNRVCQNSNSNLSSQLNTFCTQIQNNQSKVNSGFIYGRLIDKNGLPYSNLRFYLAKNNGSLSDSTSNGLFVTTDNDGFFDISNLENAGYSFILADYDPNTDNFIWTTNSKYLGHFEKTLDINIYDLILPKVLIRETVNYTSAPNLESEFKRYYAQSFTISSDLSFCGIGFGFGLGGNGSPSSLQIRSDENGSPSNNVLFEGDVLSFTGATSYNRETSFASVCDKLSKMASLNPARYWVVAYYNNIPSQISILGDTTTNTDNSNFLASDDGLNWTVYDMVAFYNGTKVFKRVEFYLSE